MALALHCSLRPSLTRFHPAVLHAQLVLSPFPLVSLSNGPLAYPSLLFGVINYSYSTHVWWYVLCQLCLPGNYIPQNLLPCVVLS